MIILSVGDKRSLENKVEYNIVYLPVSVWLEILENQ